jgi:transcriptional regulator with XRE-family HTH domain
VRVTLRKKFGNRVAALRRAASISQEELADRCGFARSYMSRIERGKANPSLDAVETLAGGLNVSVVQLFED